MGQGNCRRHQETQAMAKHFVWQRRLVSYHNKRLVRAISNPSKSARLSRDDSNFWNLTHGDINCVRTEIEHTMPNTNSSQSKQGK
jgi:hypothetical protein